MSGKVSSIYIAPQAGASMMYVPQVMALVNKGLEGDRYGAGEGSWQKGDPTKRHVTFINVRAFRGNLFTPAQSRRNIVTRGVELNKLIGHEFQVGEALFEGVKYCEPCERPSNLSDVDASFAEEFHDCGGIIALVRRRGLINVDDPITIVSKELLIERHKKKAKLGEDLANEVALILAQGELQGKSVVEVGGAITRAIAAFKAA